MNTTSVSNNSIVLVVANQTLEYLHKNFPDIIDCVPKDVLKFGIPNQNVTMLFAIFTALLMLASIIMNFFIISLYVR